ncbi:MAG: peptidoglycan editing factor PgeF [Defluviitaleaceae bacterium]|nr:peptidoglycan editing factor PgeF [Defluviitaleaceae bacterium]
MTEKTINGVIFLEFELFKDSNWFKHCFSTRIGGVSKGHSASLNFRAKDESRENLTENYKRICAAASLSFDGLTFSYQEHGANIRTITASDRGKGLHKKRDYSNIDGLITNEPNICLTTFYADCTPVFLADPVTQAVGLIHAGWRSTYLEIAKRAVEEMVREYNTNPENILAGIGPSICCSCFEVDKPVYDKFAAYTNYIAPKNQTADKYIIDLKGINSQMLIDAGLKESNIEISPLCTKCNDRLFYSHRRDGDNRGSMAAFMEINI